MVGTELYVGLIQFFVSHHRDYSIGSLGGGERAKMGRCPKKRTSPILCCDRISLAMVSGKKSSIILILKVLEEYSDENHFLTQQDIIEKVEGDYGVTLERKSVAYSISLLQELDYDIVKSPKGGYALFSRLFDPSEARFISDALFSSKSITGKQALSLNERVNSVFSKYERKKHPYLYKSVEISRTSNKDVFYNIDLIEEGMESGKRVSFQYRTFDENGKPALRNGGYRYIVSPYYLINNYGRYYLLSNYREKYGPFNLFRVDYMIDIKIEQDWPIKPLEKLRGVHDFDIAKYLNEHIYLFDSEIVKAKILIEKPEYIQMLDDWFGKNAKVEKEDDRLIAYVTCNEDSLFYWMLQYGNGFTLLAPDLLVERVRNHLSNQVKKYGGE